MYMLADIPFDLKSETLMEQLRIAPGTEDAIQFQEMLRKAQEIARPKAAFAECFVDGKGVDTIKIGGFTFTSRMLRKNLESVERVFPFIATCGHEIDEKIPVEDDFLQEYWKDTIKASLLGSASKFLAKHIDQKFRLGKTATMSPGSGDATVWHIEQQRELFALLGNVKQAIGVRLTDSCLMIPNKTVSGIRFATEKDFRTCQVCHRKDCPSRTAPFDKQLWAALEHE
ncbi:vitamin B12 dependent methionine synthase [candidate division KSB1 bacterium]|nr:vitamin B12 dependent methionine synthase [candidate division KSB1 bacterium]